MPELASLKKQRSSNKGRLTNILNFIKNAKPDTSIEEFKTRLARVETLMSEFTVLEAKIFSIDPEEESDYLYEENYYNAVTKLNTLIRSKAMAAGNCSPDISLNATHAGHSQEIKLPKINIPSFAGEYTEWPSFYDLFSSTIHESASLSPVQKFQYLKGLLRGEAAVLLRHISVTEGNYIGALNKLKERYDRKRHIINSFIRTFVEQPAISIANSHNIKRLMDTSDEVIRGLKALGENAETRDHWLIFLLVQKLDDKSKILWAETVTGLENPQFSNFLEFMSRRIDTLEATNISLKRPIPKSNIKGHIATGESSFTCSICQGKDHSLFSCVKFNEMNINQRRDWAKTNQRCFNCLSNRHPVFRCSSNRRCSQCKKRHHTLLHLAETSESTATSNQSAITAEPLSSLLSQNISAQSILPTALISVLDSFGNPTSCRALLDSGSQASFITEACVQRLGLRKRNARLSVVGLGGSIGGTTKGLVSISIRPKHHPEFVIDALILSKITSDLPHQSITNIKMDRWPDLHLADPYFYKPARIDILIGADYFFNLLEQGQIKISEDGPILHKTILGWVIAGKVTPSYDAKITSMIATSPCADIDLDRSLRKFWELESIPNLSVKMSPEEAFCETEFSEKVQVTQEGRFVVSLPFKKSPDSLGNSINAAVQRMRGIERRFIADTAFKKLYQEFIFEYHKLGHMEEVPQSEVHTGYYLPHHGVLKGASSTTKLRVVFDGSAKTSTGVSLNDCLAIGPTVQAALHAIILRFREHKFVVTADVEKMYRQVKMNKEDANYQKIVWRNHPSEPLRHFRLTTITYGLAPSSFLATRVLKKIADDNQSSFPLAANAINHDVYVDDLMTGANTEYDVAQLKNTISTLLSQHGFNLRKWMSNSNDILEGLDDETNKGIKTIHETNQSEIGSVKVLGLNWNPTTDNFFFTSSLQEKELFTKRIIVSEASRLFDPLGWVAPVIIKIKIFIQKLWATNLEWDQILPEEITKRWRIIRTHLEKISQITIPRFIQTTINDSIQMHGFADASQDAFAAVVYLRVETSTGEIIVKLISAKTKVAPIKQVSLPRLELCATVLLTNLMNLIENETQLSISEKYAWTDSQIVLDWLASHPRRWSTFVGNRTAEILYSLPRKHWHHVASASNPADCASRGLFPDELQDHHLWWKGPDWLHQSAKVWPPQQRDYGSIEETNNKIFTFTSTADSVWFDELVSKYSSITKFQRTLAYILRFISNLKSDSTSRINGIHLTREELFHALYKACRQEQLKFYPGEMMQMTSKGEISKSSSLKSLSPFVDEFGLLRVGGRIENSEAPFSTKHPIILCSKSQLTKLILEDIHKRNKHAGPSLTLAISRQNYWIPSGRNIVRQMINKCVICVRVKAQIRNQVMGNLPSCRVEYLRPFLKVGVDYAGPIPIHMRKGRGQKTHKSYLCLFICLSTKAIHLELVGDMTSESFLGALKRFVARRGICQEIYSDNGTNFIGANNQLRQTFNKLIAGSQIISDFSSSFYISWHFNPPSAPHFGGIWEAGIKSAKFHLKRVIGSTILTFEEMGTLLAEIESTLNSRPICALHAADIDVLTPSHFLIGHPATKIPEISITHLKPSYLTRWQMVQQLSQHFWRRWHVEYLASLQPKPKWRDHQIQIKVGDIVVIKEESLSVNQWPIGKVIKLHPGSDDITRVVTLITKSGEIKRPTSKLVILPISNPSNSTAHPDEVSPKHK